MKYFTEQMAVGRVYSVKSVGGGSSMLRHSMRVLVAVLTFTIGIAIFWAFQLIPRLETAFVDRCFNNSDVGPVSLVSFDSDKEANEIYRLLVHRKFHVSSEIKLIVLQAETTGCPLYEDEVVSMKFGNTETFHQSMNKLMPEAELQTLDSYLLRNKGAQELRVSNLGINYIIVRDSDLPDGEFDDFWDRFYKKYPNSPGIVYFSNVGFNDKYDQAFVYVGRSCGGLCGSGEYVLLKKVNRSWEIVDEEELWVS
jgi:hypothetical protein